MRKNTAKAKIKAGQPVFGAILKFSSPTVVELCAYGGFDFVIFDLEHGSGNEALCRDMIRAADATGITAVARVQTLESSIIARYLDLGALGVFVPLVKSKEEAQRIVQYSKYYPEGTRGMPGKVRANEYGVMPIEQHIKEANEEILTIAHIESMEGAENLAEILTVPGLDVIMLGPGDLSESMGLPGQISHPKVVEAIDRIIRMVRASDKALGAPGEGIENAKKYLSQGALFMDTQVEGLVIGAAREFLGKVR